MRRLLLITGVLVMSAALAFGQGPGEIHPLDSDPRLVLPFDTLQKFSLSVIGEDNNYIITKRSGWKEIWKRIHPDEESRPPLPYVDFSTRMVIAVFRGQTKPLDVGIRIVYLTGSERDMLVVVVTDTDRHTTCPDVPVITSPYHIVTVAKVEKRIRKTATFQIEHVNPPDCEDR
jgi:hypothetical protein